ncbi:MAG TPA: ATP-binding protein, partial [Candidatus Nanoarchaeia archaeon]|nr:ATP-binding protein [Candidatus Nanoarchaeia archaeon]
MKEKVEISSKGIRKVLNKYNFCRAVSEYIWNGFDAGADNVEIVCGFNGGILQKLEIKDNGSGIDYTQL